LPSSSSQPSSSTTFRFFPITVLTEHPLRSVIDNPEATRRVLKWASELWSYELRYELRTTIKGQVLANFIADFTLGATEQCDLLEEWILNMDGASNIMQASRWSSPL